MSPIESVILEKFRKKLMEDQAMTAVAIEEVFNELASESSPNADKLAATLKSATGEVALGD